MSYFHELIEIRHDRKIYIEQYINTAKTGATILFFHGSSGSPKHWRTILPALNEKFNCVVVSLLGHGKSEVPLFELDKPNPYEFMEMAKDMQAVLNRYGSASDENIIIGHSRGAMLGIYLAHELPDKVKQLILLCPDTFVIEPDPSGLWQSPISELEAMRPQLEEVFQYMAFHEACDAELIASELEDARKIPMHVVQGLKLGKIIIPQLNLSQIKVPALVILGKNDLVVVESKIKSAYGVIPNVKLLVIPKAGHLVMLEQPQKVLELIMEFLKKDSSGP